MSLEISLRQLRRALGAVLPEAIFADGDGGVLEASAMAEEPPRTTGCEPLEGARVTLRVLPPAAPAVTHFTGFLDGTQGSRVVHYVAGVPIVHGRVAAVIRVRANRRMSTWGTPIIQSRLYAPALLLPPPVLAALQRTALPVIDTLAGREFVGAPHPHLLLRHAVHEVQRDREAVERELAERWCAAGDAMLFVDGALPRGDRASCSTCCIGVVKSHHTLYVGDGDSSLVLALPEGARTTVFRVAASWGPPVASWYLRLRDARGHDPMWALVRVEIALPGCLTTPEMLTRRADEISAWILAERAPLSLPDGRWDRMMYGVRDCEEYLRAVAR